MICDKCGRWNYRDNKTCEHCGNADGVFAGNDATGSVVKSAAGQMSVRDRLHAYDTKQREIFDHTDALTSANNDWDDDDDRDEDDDWDEDDEGYGEDGRPYIAYVKPSRGANFTGVPQKKHSWKQYALAILGTIFFALLFALPFQIASITSCASNVFDPSNETQSETETVRYRFTATPEMESPLILIDDANIKLTVNEGGGILLDSQYGPKYCVAATLENKTDTELLILIDEVSADNFDSESSVSLKQHDLPYQVSYSFDDVAFDPGSETLCWLKFSNPQDSGPIKNLEMRVIASDSENNPYGVYELDLDEL